MYENYLKALLSPLGVYHLGPDTINGAELFALGQAFDSVAERMEFVERESLTETAQDEGLRRREDLFLRRPAATTIAERRAAIAALLQIDGDSLTPEAINRTISGCGIRARVIEVDTNQVLIEFPDTSGVPNDFNQILKIILDIIPCHLGVEFRLPFLTWRQCQSAKYRWSSILSNKHSWRSFQRAVPPDSESPS